MKTARVAIVMPRYRVKVRILGVFRRVAPQVHDILVIDAEYAEKSGSYVEMCNCDERVKIL